MSRSRQPRANHNQDADEEKRLWGQIKAEAKKIDSMIARCGSIGNEIVEIEKQQAALLDADKLSDAALDSKLEELYRENVRLSEQIQHMIEGKSDEVNLLDNIRILQALRESAEESVPLSASSVRSASANGGAKSRAALVAKRKANGNPGSAITDDGDDSTISSPRGSGRLNAVPGREKSARGSSAAPSMREASVKIEDGAESVTSSVDGGGTASKPASEAGNLAINISTTQQARQALIPGAMVFYRNKGRAQEGEGILCRVTSVIGEGKQRRYEIQDADPDPQPGTGEIPAPYRASVSHLYAIPASNALPDLAKGRNVLAQYPDTTTFYKAEVSTPWRAKDLSGEKGAYVRLRFEGEMEEAKEMEVERRFVVPDPPTSK
ncbi:SGF29 tudor-like domain-containing protein [Elsinoe ampelina]|uniref:SGF29 tudor-like domain-containing protein n=1 Tax=Elsinoe ampelina TaxID=302913 RepID=A0A6A6G8F8_9PEZI|nr:SGF29 tudor-like domain-containing protein [Elsinoe ampelina]